MMTERMSVSRPALGKAFATVAFLLCSILVNMKSIWHNVLR